MASSATASSSAISGSILALPAACFVMVIALPRGSTRALPIAQQRAAGVLQLAAGELALGGLDGAGKLPTLRNAYDDTGVGPGINVAVGQRLDDLADAGGVDADRGFFRQQAGIRHQLDMVGEVGDVVADSFHDGQVAVLDEVEQRGGDVLAALQYHGVAPGVYPGEPDTGAALATKDDEAEQVVEAAAVDADRRDLAPRQQVAEVEAGLGIGLPVLGAGPAV